MEIGPGRAVNTPESTKKGIKCNKMSWAAVNSWKYNVYKTMILLIDLESSHHRQNVYWNYFTVLWLEYEQVTLNPHFSSVCTSYI